MRKQYVPVPLGLIESSTVLDHIIHIRVLLFRNMPDIENLMQEWPSEFEDVLTEVFCICT